MIKDETLKGMRKALVDMFKCFVPDGHKDEILRLAEDGSPEALQELVSEYGNSHYVSEVLEIIAQSDNPDAPAHLPDIIYKMAEITSPQSTYESTLFLSVADRALKILATSALPQGEQYKARINEIAAPYRPKEGIQFRPEDCF